MHNRENFTAYETMPEEMAIYMSHNGPHFSKKLFEFAISKMYKTDSNGRKEEVNNITKKDLDSLLKTYGVTIENDYLYDAAYVANMCKADFYGDSIPNDDYMTRWVKNVLDDPDAVEGLIFNRWVADMKWLGIPIDWEEMI